MLPTDPLKHEEYKKKISDSAIKRFQDKEFRDRHIQSCIKRASDPERRQRQSEIAKRSVAKTDHQDPEYKRKHKIGMEKLSKDPQWLCDITLRNRALLNNPEYKRKHRDGCLKRSNNPEWKRKNREILYKNATTPEIVAKQIETKVGGFWYGNVDNESNKKPTYCELWKDVNPRVHAFFNYECCLCHTPENGKSHMGHHVFYVKEACCWQSDDGIYYTNLNASDHQEHDYYIGENPNYFVILCPSCHGRTNGFFANRKKWADYFKNMIDEKYNGKCYLTEEEMAGSLR